MYQIVSNLTSNALKFTHYGGVTISLSIDDVPPQEQDRYISPLSVSFLLFHLFYLSSHIRPLTNNFYSHHISLPLEASTSPGSSQDLLPSDLALPNLEHPNQEFVDCVLALKVQDTGIGMSDEEQARLFKRFSQANNRTAQVCKTATKKKKTRRRRGEMKKKKRRRRERTEEIRGKITNECVGVRWHWSWIGCIQLISHDRMLDTIMRGERGQVSRGEGRGEPIYEYLMYLRYAGN